MISRGLLAAFLVVAVGCGATTGTAAVDSKRKPVVVLVSDDPVSLRGRNFVPRELLTVRLSVGNRLYTKRVRATSLGMFSAQFATVAATECDPIGVSVAGTAGSRAGLAKKIQIPAACGISPQPGTPPSQP